METFIDRSATIIGTNAPAIGAGRNRQRDNPKHNNIPKQNKKTVHHMLLKKIPRQTVEGIKSTKKIHPKATNYL
jgi:hypothetical protein